MRLLRKKAPSVPATLWRSASASSARCSLPENCRRRAVATTSGSGGAVSLGIPSLALRTPPGMPKDEEEEVLFIEVFNTAAMTNTTFRRCIVEGGCSGSHWHRGSPRSSLTASTRCYAVEPRNPAPPSPPNLLPHSIVVYLNASN